jgi:ATP-binding cassette subfamily B protein
MAVFGQVVRRGSGWLGVLALTSLAASASSLALPAVLGHVVDSVAVNGSGTRWIAWAVGLIGVGVVADLVDTFAGAACVANTTAWLRHRLITHALAIGPQRAGGFEVGDLVSRVSSGAADAAQAGPSTVMVAVAALPPMGSLVALAVIDVWLAVAFLAGVVLVALLLRTFTRQTSEVMVAYQRVQGQLAARLTESLAGIRTVAAAGTLDHERRRVLRPLPELHSEGLRLWRILSRTSGQAAIVGPLVLVSVLAAGGLALTHGRITAGELFAASQYAVLGVGLGSLTGVLGRLARARAGSQRAQEILEIPPLAYGERALPDGPGRLEFRHATVRTATGTLLDGVDLVVPGGATVAVVGRSGSGKSVLATLAARLRDPDEGEVLLDAVPLPELSHDTVRRAIGCAFERPTLVGATVGDAIGLGLDAARVEQAARATCAHDFVSRLPDGYRTPLSTAAMSGGEAQRLGLARAWPAERVLVLDDAMSSLDMVTEMQIHHTLVGDANERTRLIVTHRVSTAGRADLVVWLADGQVRAVGPHERLWLDPAYRAVFQ